MQSNETNAIKTQAAKQENGMQFCSYKQSVPQLLLARNLRIVSHARLLAFFAEDFGNTYPKPPSTPLPIKNFTVV